MKSLSIACATAVLLFSSSAFAGNDTITPIQHSGGYVGLTPDCPAGFTKTNALFFNFVTGIFAILGTMIALLVGARVENFAVVMLPLAAGGFIYIAGSDLVPELNKEVELSKSLVQLVAIATGVGLMLSLALME